MEQTADMEQTAESSGTPGKRLAPDDVYSVPPSVPRHEEAARELARSAAPAAGLMDGGALLPARADPDRRRVGD
nr:unnamed protein product [Digitaria exilis]